LGKITSWARDANNRDRTRDQDVVIFCRDEAETRHWCVSRPSRDRDHIPELRYITCCVIYEMDDCENAAEADESFSKEQPSYLLYFDDCRATLMADIGGRQKEPLTMLAVSAGPCVMGLILRDD